MKNKKYVIYLSAVFLFLLGGHNSSAQSLMEQKVDSLFMIASSGDIKFKDLVKPAIDSLAAMGGEITPLLIEKFDTKSARERVTLMNIIKKIGKPATPYLINSLGNSDGLIVSRVCSSLGDLKDSSAVEPLIGVKNHQRWQVREQAIGALGDIRDAQGSETVVEALADSIGQVRKSACVAAGKIDIETAIPQLVSRLGDDFYGARMSAKEALLKMDTAAVTGCIADSILSDNKFVGLISCQILAEYKTEPALEILYHTFMSGNKELRTPAAEALISADPENHCGYTDAVKQADFDRLSKIKIESALKNSEDEQ